jgi:hypothetical protein
MPARIRRAGPPAVGLRAEVAHLSAVEATHPELPVQSVRFPRGRRGPPPRPVAQPDQWAGCGGRGEGRAPPALAPGALCGGARIHLVEGSSGHHPDHRIPFEVLDRQGADPATITKHSKAIADGEDLPSKRWDM